ncbi:hypothetical protein ACFL6U_18975 [Planctomycetota bacterium]
MKRVEKTMFDLDHALYILTFPGLVMRRFIRSSFARLQVTESEELMYHGNTNADMDREASPQALISICLFFINTVFGIILGSLAWLYTMTDTLLMIPCILLVWLSVTMAVHAFPSIDEAQRTWQLLQKKNTPWIAKLVGRPLAGIMLVGALGSLLQLDLIYGIAIGIGLPWLFLG